MPYLPQRKRVKLISSWQPKHVNSFYTSPAWRKYRINYLKKHPMCIECKKIDLVMQATVVDHIVPILQGGDPWNETNLQPLCHIHHAKKSAREAKHQGRGV